MLINKCYIEYCKNVYSSVNIESQNYRFYLLEYKNKKQIWDTVFNSVTDLLTYYLHLSVNHVGILNIQDRVNYTQNRLSNNYEQISFQMFVDNQISFQNIGYTEYQNFVKSMKNPLFKKKMVDKYKTFTEITTLKNHIIYIVHLHLTNKNIVHLHLTNETNSSNMFTDEELADMDTMINAIPYFEHLSKNYWTIYDVESGIIHKNTDFSAKYTNFNLLESRVLKDIAKSL
jgi:hypothetical protein